MVRRVLGVAVALVAVVVGLVVGSAPAGADCSGPMILPIEPQVRGDVMTVTGEAFGNNCYDTGPPPDGEGVLGVPVPDIELFIAQDGNEVIVARGAADEGYEFSVDVQVPPRLSPGTATVIARWGDDRSLEQTFEVLADPPIAEPPATTPMISFGPDPASTSTSATPTTSSGTSASDEGGEGGGDDGGSATIAGAAVVLVLVVGAGLWWTRRRRA